jgi:hypothetical protein
MIITDTAYNKTLFTSTVREFNSTTVTLPISYVRLAQAYKKAIFNDQSINAGIMESFKVTITLTPVFDSSYGSEEEITSTYTLLLPVNFLFKGDEIEIRPTR